MSERAANITAILLSFLSFVLFVFFQAQGIYGGDSGDLVTAAYLAGVPHPPGYPLYTLLGFLLSHLPIFTVAWRVSLLSSLPHALVVGLVFLIIYRLTKLYLPAVFGSLALVGNYLFFLYATTPEVFALLDLFIVLLVYLLLRWRETRKVSYLYWASWVFGLSLTHHQVILFFVPALAYYLWVNQKILAQSVSFIRLLAYFVIGLLPYLYIPLAARGSSIINWDLPVDLPGFWRLVTRADYGTFVSGGFYGQEITSRLLQLKAYAEIWLTDFTWVGTLFSLAGWWWIFRRQRQFGFFLLLTLFFLGPAFFFYASFPLLSRFNLGTYERFLLPSYLVLSLMVGLGFWQVILLGDQLLRRRLLIWRTIGKPALVAVLFVYPVTMLAVTSWKFVGLPTDQTANNLGLDILTKLPAGSLVLLSRDTPLFTTQYVRYALGVRPDTAVLHASLLAQPSYSQTLKKVFPNLIIPAATGDFPVEFIKANRNRYPIFTNVLYPLDPGWFWVPYGLVYQLKPEADLPTTESYSQESQAIWSSLHDPAQGVLRRFNHLMLADVRDVYASSRVELGRIFLKAGQIVRAKEQFEKALAYGGDTQVSDTYTLLGLTEFFLNDCQAALSDFQKAKVTSPVPDKMISFYEAITYRDCAGDKAAAQKLFDEYERLRKQEEMPLR